MRPEPEISPLREPSQATTPTIPAMVLTPNQAELFSDPALDASLAKDKDSDNSKDKDSDNSNNSDKDKDLDLDKENRENGLRSKVDTSPLTLPMMPTTTMSPST